MRFASSSNYPQGTAWATHRALTTTLTANKPRFQGVRSALGLFPNDPSASSLALTASTPSAADYISWAFFAGIMGFAGWVGYEVWTNRKR